MMIPGGRASCCSCQILVVFFVLLLLASQTRPVPLIISSLYGDVWSGELFYIAIAANGPSYKRASELPTGKENLEAEKYTIS